MLRTPSSASSDASDAANAKSISSYLQLQVLAQHPAAAIALIMAGELAVIVGCIGLAVITAGLGVIASYISVIGGLFAALAGGAAVGIRLFEPESTIGPDAARTAAAPR